MNWLGGLVTPAFTNLNDLTDAAVRDMRHLYM
jgi:hypothetical protein